MKSENIETNTTKGQINSANELISENFEHEALTANTKYCTINSTDIENGSAELVLISPLEGDDSGISVACVEDEECCDPSLSENEEDIVVGDIEIYPSNLTVGEGLSEYLNVKVSPETATNKSVSWYSENEEIAKVFRNGVVNGVKAGKTTISAKTNDGSNKIASCSVTVVAVSVDSITLSHKAKTLDPGGVTVIGATVCPCNASDKTIIWSSSNTDVAIVSDTGLINAKAEGTAIISAQSIDGNAIDTCIITVDSREKVTVEMDTDKENNRIILPNGKVWRCINRDIINSDNLNANDPIIERSHSNVYATREVGPDYNVYYSDPISYSDEEIKLIYTLDPYGLAAYVREYADTIPTVNDDYDVAFAKRINYKDRIFTLLFNRFPEYYARRLDGTWYITTDKSNLTSVISESELLFGYHTVWDGLTIWTAIDFIVSVISVCSGFPALKKLSNVLKVDTIIKYYSLISSVAAAIVDGDFNGFVEAQVSGYVEEKAEDWINEGNYKTQNYKLNWAFKLLSLSSNWAALEETFNNGPHFYKELFTHCVDDLNYNIVYRMADGQVLSMADINNATP